jgi:DNA-binding GntR family transcriptional regulator
LASFCRIAFKVSTICWINSIPGHQRDDSETLSENVFRRIQAAIVKGEIAPGSKISEPELARTYGISRGPLREAIHRLEGQRLLVRVPHVGARWCRSAMPS